MYNCKDTCELLYDYVEGTIEPALGKQLERHLSNCPGCIAYVNTYRHTINASKELVCANIPPELQRKLRSFIKHKIHRPSLWSWLRARLLG